MNACTICGDAARNQIGNTLLCPKHSGEARIEIDRLRGSGKTVDVAMIAARMRLEEESPRNAGGVIRYARRHLGMTQEQFGAWLAEKVGKDNAYSMQQISNWEQGQKSPRLNVRLACREEAAKAGIAAIGEAQSLDAKVAILIDCQS